MAHNRKRKRKARLRRRYERRIIRYLERTIREQLFAALRRDAPGHFVPTRVIPYVQIDCVISI